MSPDRLCKLIRTRSDLLESLVTGIKMNRRSVASRRYFGFGVRDRPESYGDAVTDVIVHEIKVLH
jgi:hypothetical protein